MELVLVFKGREFVLVLKGGELAGLLLFWASKLSHCELAKKEVIKSKYRKKRTVLGQRRYGDFNFLLRKLCNSLLFQFIHGHSHYAHDRVKLKQKCE